MRINDWSSDVCPSERLVMTVAITPSVALRLVVTNSVVPWETRLLSVVLYVVIPLMAGAIARRQVIRSHDGNEAAVDAFTARLKPWSIIGLLATVVLLFAFQAETIISNPLLIVLKIGRASCRERVGQYV